MESFLSYTGSASVTPSKDFSALTMDLMRDAGADSSILCQPEGSLTPGMFDGFAFLNTGSILSIPAIDPNSATNEALLGGM